MLQILLIILITNITLACGTEDQSNRKLKRDNKYVNPDALPEIKKIVKGIENENSVESSHIGIAGKPSEQWARYEQLKKAASIKQLEALTDHKNAAVRCYAFQALASKKASSIFKVLLTHLNDTSLVSTKNGCVGMECYVGDYLIDVVTPEYIESTVYKLNLQEQQTLDSILLYDKSIQLSAKSRMLGKLDAISKNYARIRELVINNRDESALKVLAKYQKQGDKEIISSFFKDNKTQISALNAVVEFPDEYFYPSLKKIFEQEWKQESYDYRKWRMCYQALAKFPRGETVKFFERTTNSKDEFRYGTLCKYLLVAITKYPNKLYDPVKSNIKLSTYQMDEVKYELESIH